MCHRGRQHHALHDSWQEGRERTHIPRESRLREYAIEEEEEEEGIVHHKTLLVEGGATESSLASQR